MTRRSSQEEDTVSRKNSRYYTMEELKPIDAPEKSLSFHQIDRSFLRESFTWLEDASFRRLILAAPVTRKVQRKWFEELRNRSDYIIWGMKCEGSWIGAFGIKNISLNKRIGEFWMYIYPQECRGRGIGKIVITESIRIAKAMGLDKLYLKVCERNDVALSLYERMGFKHRVSRNGIVYMEQDL